MAATLDDLIKSARKLVGQCTECGRERDIDPASLPLPRATPASDAGLKMRCRDCRSERRIHTFPQPERGAI